MHIIHLVAILAPTLAIGSVSNGPASPDVLLMGAGNHISHTQAADDFVAVAPIWFDVRSVSVSAPSSCDPNGNITVTVTVDVRTLVGTGSVTLYEDDVFCDDTIGTKRIRRGPGESTNNFSEDLTFTFCPSNYEKGAKLELYAKAGSEKSPVVTVKQCKKKTSFRNRSISGVQS